LGPDWARAGGGQPRLKAKTRSIKADSRKKDRNTDTAFILKAIIISSLSGHVSVLGNLIFISNLPDGWVAEDANLVNFISSWLCGFLPIRGPKGRAWSIIAGKKTSLN
jgi:hypothetical protein